MRTFDKKFNSPTFMFLWSQSLHVWQIHWVFPSDFCWNKNKNKPKQPLLYSLFQDSEGTSTSTETNNTLYESPDIQLFGALRIRAWHHHGGATPTSRKTVCYFSFWGRGGQEGWIHFIFFYFVKIPHLINVQIPFLWLKSAFLMAS